MSRKKMKNLQFAVLGLGIFGAQMVKTLAASGCEVLAVDSRPSRVDEVRDYATHCVVADATDERVLVNLGISNFDNVIIGIGTNNRLRLCAHCCAKNWARKM